MSFFSQRPRVLQYLRGLKTRECRVGVIGQYASGKSVFLTSLINHLQSHDPDRFILGSRGTIVRRFRAIEPEPGWSVFPFPAYRDSLVHQGHWPEKTTDRLQYRCEFERSDWSIHDVRLNLFDLPGERLADAMMLGRDYANWSDQILQTLQNDTPYRQLCTSFLEAVTTSTANEAELIHHYKLALGRLILAYKPLISPSTFLLDLHGGKARGRDAETLAATRLCGLSQETQFVPLPASLRNTGLAVHFASRFQEYQNQVVQHFLDALRSCHALIVLLDVPMILAGGVGMYDDNRQMIQELVRALEPGQSLWGTVAEAVTHTLLPADWRPHWLNRMAFVCPKVDLVLPDDRDLLPTLMKRMIGPLAADRDGLSVGFFNTAAVVSTQPLRVGSELAMVGRPLRDAEGRKISPGDEQRFTPSRIPTDWPLNWEAGEFAFPEVYPQVPRRKDYAPDQIGLDQVLTFVLG